MQAVARILFVLDTGAGPNFIRTDEIGPESLKAIQSGTNATFLGANSQLIQTRETIGHFVRSQNYIARDKFFVCDDIRTRVLLGDHFHKYLAASIYPFYQTVELFNKDKLVIAHISGWRTNDLGCSTVNILEIIDDVVQAARGKRIDRVTVCKRTNLNPQMLTWVTVIAKREGSVVVEPATGLILKRNISSAYGIQNIKANVPFYMLVANFSDQTVVLPRTMAIDQVLVGLLG